MPMLLFMDLHVRLTINEPARVSHGTPRLLSIKQSIRISGSEPIFMTAGGSAGDANRTVLSNRIIK